MTHWRRTTSPPGFPLLSLVFDHVSGKIMRNSLKRGEKVAGRVNFLFSFLFFLYFFFLPSSPSRDDPMRGGGVIRKR